ncbi:MAG: ATP synthase F1 subunit epsilon [Proteobacteria bacterium]|nr:ATP synthase F1 subunit epsilon [Pseudomonadota bacterium]
MMTLSLLTPQKKLLENQTIEELFAPGIEGTLNILDGHANFLTDLETGVLKWKSNGTWSAAAVSFGWLEVFGEKITVLADVAEVSSDIDINRVKVAEKIARQKIEEGGLDLSSFRKYELKLKRAMARNNAVDGL